VNTQVCRVSIYDFLRFGGLNTHVVGLLSVKILSNFWQYSFYFCRNVCDKQRFCCEHCINFSFTVTEKKRDIHLSFVRNDAMERGLLESHSDTNHSRLDKPVEFFGSRLQCLKHVKVNTAGAVYRNMAKFVEAPHQLLLLNSQRKENTRLEKHVTLCRSACTNFLLVPKSRKCYRISQCHNTENCRTDELTEKVKRQDLEFFFAI
jgi:hypothetical protein